MNSSCFLCPGSKIEQGEMMSHMMTHITGSFRCRYCLQLFNIMTMRQAGIHWERCREEETKTLEKLRRANFEFEMAHAIWKQTEESKQDQYETWKLKMNSYLEDLVSIESRIRIAESFSKAHISLAATRQLIHFCKKPEIMEIIEAVVPVQRRQNSERIKKTQEENRTSKIKRKMEVIEEYNKRHAEKKIKNE